MAWIMVLAATAAMAVSVQYFQALPEGMDVRLEWEIDNNATPVRFELHRKLEGEAGYTRIAIINPTGNRKYTYMDADLLRQTDTQVARTIFYRLNLVTNSGEASYFATVAHNPSAVQRSWGSIKSMFR